MKKLINESKKYQIDTLTGIITNIVINKTIPLQWDGTFMILEDKKLQEFKVIFENGKYKAIRKEIDLKIKLTEKEKKEKIKQYNKEYYKGYYEENKEKRKQYNKEYYLINKRK